MVKIRKCKVILATMPKSRWEDYDEGLIGSCDLTRQIIGGLPPHVNLQKTEELSIKNVREVDSFPPTEVSTFKLL